ncbi:MAG: hypothetical protein A2W93_02255 [Bacteroidetes bacterium GWF2_43_63]|nr:MAG: hypothetical protein A2W93_02255 [Bacteroidetes bacterium GWF2_43_63]HBG69287.1 hypothetical protein [Bacteroidales bacterium]HCB60341.1 hypothetical protein [Bacteroidales bacterium]HCY23672.1 hypothetical protein [Bacteroidales bacterium]
MKNILLFSFLILFFCGLKAQDYNPIVSDVNSIEINDQCGVFQFTVDYVFLDTISIQRSSQILAPNGWNVSLTPNLAGGVYEKGDSVNVIVTVRYPVDSSPLFSQTIQIIHHADSAAESFEFYTIAKVFFTPYNTVEIWNTEDYFNLPRRWFSEDNIPENIKIRQFLTRGSIPVSNIDTNFYVNWYDSTRNWSDDDLDNFSEVYIPGLAYSVLMKPIPNDSIIFHNAYGDGIDSADVDTTGSIKAGCWGKWFSGTVSGKIEANITNDIRAPIDIQLGGLKVELVELDTYGGNTIVWQNFGHAYTNDQGEYTISYNECQIWEGDNVELSIQIVSVSDDEYKITAANIWGNRFKFKSAKWDAPQDAGNQTYNKTFSSTEDPSEAFKAVHWVRKGFMYCKNQGVSLQKNLQIKPYAVGSWFESRLIPPVFEPTIHLKSGDGIRENTPYHEFGHFTMFRLQGNNFTIPFGVNGADEHSWGKENTSRLAWVEGWADAIQMILDAAYWEEDYEYGFDREGYFPRCEVRSHYSWDGANILFQKINNGFRSEYYIACSIYDLWDGSSRGLSSTLPGTSYHGWDDSNQGLFGWKTTDDIELSFYQICRPLIENTGDNNPNNEGGYYFREKCFNIQDYLFYLFEYNDCKTRADISRAFRENRVQWNIPEYEWGWHCTNISSDFIRQSENKSEYGYVKEIIWGVINFYPKSWIDYYMVNYFNENAVNSAEYLAYEYFTGHPQQNDFTITDNYWLGIWDTYSNVFRKSTLKFNNELNVLGNLPDATFSTCGQIEMDVRYGNITLGGTKTTAKLEIGDGSILRIRGNGNENDLLINNSSELLIKQGGTLYIQSGADIRLKPNSNITVENGGFICIEDGAVLNLEDITSVIQLNSGAINGINPSLSLLVPCENCTGIQNSNINGLGQIIIEDCAEFANYTDYNEINISGNIIWSSEAKKIKKDIVIDNASVLTIENNSFIEFAPKSKVIIKPGGKLIVDNSTLSNLQQCDQLWQGIELQGNSSLSQLTPGAQGQVILKNGAVIENAIDGITTIGNVEDMSSWDWSKTGGIIKAENSTFRNCRRGIQFLHYDNIHPILEYSLPNLSYIKNCTFETTADLPDGIIPFAFISMYEVNGVKLYGNTFRNTNPNATWNKLGTGIQSINASFIVDQSCLSATIPCSNIQKSRFVNLGFGIHATATPNLKAVNIKNSVFNLCRFGGVYLSGIEYPTIINNEFIVDDFSLHIIKYQYSYGLYLDQCNGYKVENNNFISPNLTERGWTGIYVNNSNTGNGANAANEIYRNTFTDLYSGIVALNDNDGDGEDDGLAFHCETFTSNTYDISVLPRTNMDLGISQTQGFYLPGSLDPTTMVRNSYSAPCTIDENQFKIDWNQYANPDDIQHANYTGSPWQPGCCDQKIKPTSPEDYGESISQSPSHCPDRTINKPISIRTELQVVAVKIEELNNLVDGGQTNLLVSIAQSNIPDGQMLQTMLEFSPYLSDEVLLTLIERPNALSPGTMQQILTANSPLSDEVYQAVQSMQSPLPKGIHNQIAALQTGEMSARDMLPSGIAYYEYTEKVLESDLVRYYLNDTLTVNPMDSVVKILEETTSRNSKLNLVSAYISTRHFAKANQTLDSLVNIDADLVSYSDKQRMNIQTLDLPGGELSIISDSTKMQALQAIANDTLKYGAVYARNALELLNDTLFQELTLIPMPDVDNRSMITYSTGSQPEIEQGLLSCYPNPAGEKFTAHYEVEAACAEMFIVIHDVMGREVSSIRVSECMGDIELDSPAKSGTYYVYIESCGRYIAIDKIVITR